MMSKFPGSDHSCRRRYANKLYVGKKNKNEIYICEAVCDAVREWSVVTRPSADCQTTFFGRFKRFGKILKKVAERSRNSGRRSRDRRPTVKQRFLDVSSDLGKFWKKSLNGHATVVEVTRPSADCQSTFFGRFKQLEKILKKVAERSRDSGRRSRDRRPTVKQRFLDVSSDLGKFWKKSLNGHATVVGGHATVGRLSNNVFWTFQAIWENLKKVAEQSRDSGRRSRDRRLTVKQRFWTFQAIRKLFVKSHRRVTRLWSVVTRLSADCQAHICMYIIINERETAREREREREREKERESEREKEREWERERDRIQKSGRKKLPRQFPRLLTPVPSLSVFHGNLPQQIRDTTSPMFIMGNLFPSWGINELEFSRQNQKFSSSYP